MAKRSTFTRRRPSLQVSGATRYTIVKGVPIRDASKRGRAAGDGCRARMQQRRAGIARESDRRSLIVAHERRHPFRVERGSNRYCVNVFRTEKLRRLQEQREDARQPRRAGCPAAKRSTAARIKLVFARKLLAADGRRGQVGQRMSDKLRRDAALAIELLFEGKDHQHLANVFANALDAALLPRPQLRADVIDDRHSAAGEARAPGAG